MAAHAQVWMNKKNKKIQGICNKIGGIIYLKNENLINMLFSIILYELKYRNSLLVQCISKRLTMSGSLGWVTVQLSCLLQGEEGCT